MRVCRHGCDVKMFCFSREFEKGVELKTSTSLLYLPISSSAETWIIFRNMLCQFCFARAYVLREKNPYFESISFCKTRTDDTSKLRVQDFATGKNLSFNYCSKQESFSFFSRESYFIKAIENVFPVFAYPDINTRGVGRIHESYANPRLHNYLEFSQPLSCLYQAIQTPKTLSVA